MNYTKLWGVGEALAPPNLGRNKNKKRLSHKPKFQNKRSFSQSSDNRADEIGGARMAPLDVRKKRSKVSSLKITKTESPPIALMDLSIGN